MLYDKLKKGIMMEKPIYEITCFYIEENRIKRERNWMFFYDKETALSVVKNNRTDIFEHNFYNYAMITRKYPGLEHEENRFTLYKAEYEEDGFNPKVTYVENNDLTRDWYNYVREEDL